MGNIADELAFGLIQLHFPGNVLHRDGNPSDAFAVAIAWGFAILIGIEITFPGQGPLGIAALILLMVLAGVAQVPVPDRPLG